MTPDDFKVGQRVRVIERIEIYPLGIYPVGTTGTVVSIDKRRALCAEVHLDGEHPELADWDGNLQVMTYHWEACAPRCWEVIETA